jgi:hypothetical protein
LNHNYLINKKDEEVIKILIEIASINRQLTRRNLTLKVYELFWNTRISSGILQSLMYKINSMDEAKVILMSIIDRGPYYFEQETIKVHSIPSIPPNTFPEKLMGICFNDKQQFVISLINEEILNVPNYHLKFDFVDHAVRNIRGINQLEGFISELNPISNINEVFNTLNIANIVILESAVKSSRKHNFEGRFQDIKNALITLSNTELPLISEGANEELRKRRFKETCGYEISKESTITVNHPRYKREREFIIPETGKVLFEWHIKIGNSIRIHYYIDTINQKIYIGHCGRHLGTTSYNS